MGDKIKFEVESMKILVGEFKIACHMLAMNHLINEQEYKEKLAYIKDWEDVLYE